MAVDYSGLLNREALKEILVRYRKKILQEMDAVKDLTSLVMRGSRRRWTPEELRQIKEHLLVLGKKIPVLLVFMLPGGTVLLPLLVEVLDRRKRNIPVAEERRKPLRKKGKGKRSRSRGDGL
jgi:hypothetical protein